MLRPRTQRRARLPDCAQGAFHAYWLSVAGTDHAKAPPRAPTSPTAICARQHGQIVLACWYRAFIDTRPVGYQTASANDIKRTCRRLAGLQRQGCVTAASVIGPTNPLTQMRICRTLPAGDRLPCVHGVKVQNLIGTAPINSLRVIERCRWFTGPTRYNCVHWLAKTLAVVDDGKFATTGCAKLPPSDRRACRAGARSYNTALVTFS